jgi:beta-glucosidase
VAIVVFGETPYAEGVGDIKTLEFQPGTKTDLALLKKMKAAGVPVVSVFLSGRPLWVNPEINASDAFVAAWLPGSEGGGIADVLVGDAAGKPRTDFRGKLSFSWPRTAGQFTLNRGDKNYAPLFAYGYGLTYASKVRLGALSEKPGFTIATENVSDYFVGGKTPAPFTFQTSQSAEVQIRPVDAGGVQEAGRQFIYLGRRPAAVSIEADRPINLGQQTAGGYGLRFGYRLDAKPTGPVSLSIASAKLDMSASLAEAALGQWTTMTVPLRCFQKQGADMTQVKVPFVLSTSGTLTLSVHDVKLVQGRPTDACPG